MPGALPAVSYGGHCVTCSRRHALRPDAAAMAAARALARRIMESGRLDFDAPGPGDPRFTIDYLDGSKGPGRMLGVLLALEPPVPVASTRGTRQEPAAAASDGRQASVAGGAGTVRVLKAFSGQITEDWWVPGWVGPVQAITSAGPYYAAVRRLTEELSARIERLKYVQRRAEEVAASGCGAGGSEAAPARGKRRGGGGARGGGGRGAGSAGQQGAAEKFVAAQLELLTSRRKGLSHHLLEQVRKRG